MGDEWMGDDDDLLLLRRVVCRSVGPFVIPVAGRGGRAGVQDDVPAVSRRGRESEPRVHRACRRGTWLVAEALGLPPDGLAHFYGPRDERTQHRSKVGAPRAQSCPCPCDEDPLPIYARAAREP